MNWHHAPHTDPDDGHAELRDCYLTTCMVRAHYVDPESDPMQRDPSRYAIGERIAIETLDTH